MEDRGLKFRREHWMFPAHLSYPYSRTMALGLTQPTTEMSTSNHPVDEARPVRKASTLTANYEPII
jgi:hypothetical protein